MISLNLDSIKVEKIEEGYLVTVDVWQLILSMAASLFAGICLGKSVD